MHRTFIYFLLTSVVVVSCLVEYWGARLLASLSVGKQERIAFVSMVSCALMLLVFPANFVVTDCFVLAGSLFAGFLLGRQIGSNRALAAFLATAAIVDIISTYAGPTRWIVNHAQQPHHTIVPLQLLSVSFRLRGELIGVIGVGDLFVFTVCVSVGRRLGWPKAAALLVPLLGILSALGVGLFSGLTPALPFLAAAVIVYTYASATIQRIPCH